MSLQQHVSSMWTRLVLEALERAGLDKAELCKKSGIDPRELNDNQYFVDQDCLTRMWDEAVRMSGDSAIGLVMADGSLVRQLCPLVYSLVGSENLKMAFERLRDFRHLLSQAIDIDIGAFDDGYYVEFVNHGNLLPPAPQSIDAAMASFMVIVNWVTEEQVKPQKAEFSHGLVGNRKAYEKIINCPLGFNGKNNRLYFSRSDFEKTLPTANEVMAKSHADALRNMLDQLQVAGFSEQVRKQIIENISTGEATVENIAQTNNMNKRTFQRRLKEEGYTFSEIVDAVRMELAKEYLCRTGMAVENIAVNLGFSEPAAFMRAFKRWYQDTPINFKKNNGIQASN